MYKFEIVLISYGLVNPPVDKNTPHSIMRMAVLV